MPTIGITGALASGKSTVTEELRLLGATVFDADDFARDAIAHGTPGLAAVVAAFGKQFLLPNGEAHRAALAQLVFSDSSARQKLESIIHPIVHSRFLSERSMVSKESLVFYSVPLLFESSRDLSHIDLSIVVSCRPEQSVARAIQRGMTAADAHARLAAQLPIAEKETMADITLDNSGSIEQLRSKVTRLFRLLNRCE